MAHTWRIHELGVMGLTLIRLDAQLQDAESSQYLTEEFLN